jgi:hypothetical protein
MYPHRGTSAACNRFFLASEIAPERKAKQATGSHQRRTEKEFFRLEYDCVESCFFFKLTDTQVIIENSKIKEHFK